EQRASAVAGLAFLLGKQLHWKILRRQLRSIGQVSGRGGARLLKILALHISRSRGRRGLRVVNPALVVHPAVSLRGGGAAGDRCDESRGYEETSAHILKRSYHCDAAARRSAARARGRP